MKFYAKASLFATAAVLSWTLASCGPTIVTPGPPPSQVTDLPASCASTCVHIGPKTAENPEALDCEEGRPTADGQTCQQVCEGIPNTTQDYLDCVRTVTACDQISRCPR